MTIWLNGINLNILHLANSSGQYATLGFLFCFAFELELGNKLNLSWVVETVRVKFGRYKAAIIVAVRRKEKSSCTLLNSFSIKLQNTKISYFISLKYIKPLPGREKMCVRINVTNLVCSWVQHKWLAFLFYVQMTTCQSTRSGNYFKPGQHRFSHLGKTKQIKMMRNIL